MRRVFLCLQQFVWCTLGAVAEELGSKNLKLLSSLSLALCFCLSSNMNLGCQGHCYLSSVFFHFYLFLCYMYVCLPEYMSVHHMYSALRCRESLLFPLRLELPTVVSSRLMAVNE